MTRAWCPRLSCCSDAFCRRDGLPMCVMSRERFPMECLRPQVLVPTSRASRPYAPLRRLVPTCESRCAAPLRVQPGTRALRQGGQGDRGASRLSPRVRQDPIRSQRWPQIHTRQGDAGAGARQTKTQEALAEFDQAIGLDPNNTQALLGRGLLYQGEQQHQLAIDDFTAANGLATTVRTAARARDQLSRT